MKQVPDPAVVKKRSNEWKDRKDKPTAKSQKKIKKNVEAKGFAALQDRMKERCIYASSGRTSMVCARVE